MKKFLIILSVLGFTLTVNANAQEVAPASANSMHSVILDFQIGPGMDLGSDVGYNDGSKYVMKRMRSISNFFSAMNGTFVTVYPRVQHRNGGTLRVTMIQDGNIIDTYYEGGVATASRSFYISGGSYIIVRIEEMDDM